MADAGGTTASSELENVVEQFIHARALNPTLPDIVPRAIAIAKTLPDSGEVARVLKKAAVAYAARGEFDRAVRLVQGFNEDYDLEDGAHEIAVQFAKLGQYDRALQLADKAGDYFGSMALVQIATEALRRRDKTKALEIVTRTDSLIAKTRKDADYEPTEAEATRLSELAVLYSQLDRKSRAVELADLAFKTAKEVGKPGERYGALRSAANAYCELGLYDKAIDATKALGDYDRVQFDPIAEVGAHAQRTYRQTVFLRNAPNRTRSARDLWSNYGTHTRCPHRLSTHNRPRARSRLRSQTRCGAAESSTHGSRLRHCRRLSAHPDKRRTGPG